MFTINKDILFLIEHDDRESETIHRLASELENKYDLDICILSIAFHSHIFPFIKPKLVIVPFALSESDWPTNYFINKYRGDIQIINLNWEQHLSKMTQMYKAPKDEFAKSKLEHFSWSKGFEDYLIEGGVEPRKITTIGNPTHQLLAEHCLIGEKYRIRLSDEFGLNSQKKWIFLPMNYGWVFSSDKLIEAKIEKGFPEEYAWKYREYSQKCFKQFIKFLIKLSQDENFQIILRPHPSISCEQYQAEIAKLSQSAMERILITKKYSIREWIAASEIVGSSWSTSVWDSFNVGKRAFLFTPYPRPDWHDVWWNERVENVTSFDEFMKYCESTDANAEQVEKLTIIEDLAKWISNVQQEFNNEKFEHSAKANRLKIFLYFARSFSRYFLAKYIGGKFLDKGLLRDYFSLKI